MISLKLFMIWCDFSVFGFNFIIYFLSWLIRLGFFSSERRNKKIGIRKVLGASTSSIVFLLSGEFLKLVLIAVLIASPIAYYIMSGWLQDFAYCTNIGVGLFITAALASLVITFISVGYQSVKTSFTNSVKSLRYE